MRDGLAGQTLVFWRHSLALSQWPGRGGVGASLYRSCMLSIVRVMRLQSIHSGYPARNLPGTQFIMNEMSHGPAPFTGNKNNTAADSQPLTARQQFNL
ncbi:hypothetical protein [Dickeya lacustris]|uniref:Uncharacterized protein n=1 Tax=Dickeya lacustris TaxID=2259638 RepID=A0ABY8G6S4_9GAMM|nr:hypothetical protein [Dickeya lacustris]WFN55653.1 hypothetical protein O1Q98_19100 [Dickeya lacustris]